MNISFSSDNTSPAHSRIIKAVSEANQGYEKPYGFDKLTQEAIALLKNKLGKDPDIYFICSGTAANVISAMGALKKPQALLTSDMSHMHSDETGALESIVGSKVITVKNTDGKINVNDIKEHLRTLGSIHQAQPKMVSIAQTTELGTVYSIEELKELSKFTEENDLYFHIDGARIANACIAIDTDLKTMLEDVKVDILSLGICKNGGMIGDVIAIFNDKIKIDFKYYIKSALNLLSKNRYVAAQYLEFFKDDLFYENAKNANLMMKKLYEQLKDMGVVALNEPKANAVFVKLDKEIYEKMSRNYYFYNLFDDVCRLMTSYCTTSEDVIGFCDELRSLL